jgi:hypothetical protein
LAKRLRATSAAAAAPNSNTIGGAGAGAGGPPLDFVLPPELALLSLDPLPVAEDTSPLDRPDAEETLPLDPPDDEALETVGPPVLVEDPPLLVAGRGRSAARRRRYHDAPARSAHVDSEAASLTYRTGSGRFPAAPHFAQYEPIAAATRTVRRSQHNVGLQVECVSPVACGRRHVRL